MSLPCFGSFRQRQKKQMDFQNSRVFFPEELVTVNRSLVSADFLYLPLEAGFRDKTERSLLRRNGSMVTTRTSVLPTTLPTKQTPTQQRSTSAEAEDIETNLEICSESRNINSSADSIDSGALTSSSSSLSCFHHLEAKNGLHRSNTLGPSCPLHQHPLYRLYPGLQEHQQQQQQKQNRQEQALMSQKDESMMRGSLQKSRTRIRTNPWVHPPPPKQPSRDSNRRNNVDSLQRQNNNDICRSGPSSVALGHSLCVGS